MDQQPLVGERPPASGAADAPQRRIARRPDSTAEPRSPRPRAPPRCSTSQLLHAHRGPRAVRAARAPSSGRACSCGRRRSRPTAGGGALAGEALRRRPQVGRGIDRIGGAAEPAGDDAAEIGHLLADQEIGLAAREVGQHVARRQLELDALQLVAQPRQMARDEGGHRLAGREPHRAVDRVAEPGAAALEGLRRPLHRLASASSPSPAEVGTNRSGSRSNSRAPICSSSALIRRATVGWLTPEPAGRRGQAALARQGQETRADRPNRRSWRSSHGICLYGNVQVVFRFVECRTSAFSLHCTARSDFRGTESCISSRGCGSSPRACAFASLGTTAHRPRRRRARRRPPGAAGLADRPDLRRP